MPVVLLSRPRTSLPVPSTDYRTEYCVAITDSRNPAFGKKPPTAKGNLGKYRAISFAYPSTDTSMGIRLQLDVSVLRVLYPLRYLIAELRLLVNTRKDSEVFENKIWLYINETLSILQYILQVELRKMFNKSTKQFCDGNELIEKRARIYFRYFEIKWLIIKTRRKRTDIPHTYQLANNVLIIRTVESTVLNFVITRALT